MVQAEFHTALQRDPDKLFIVSSSGDRTYSDFYEDVCRWADALDELEPGRIGCHLPDSPGLITLIFAAAISGRSLALFNYDYTDEQLAPLIELTNAAVVVSDKAKLSGTSCRVVKPTELQAAGQNALPGSARKTASDSEIVLLTSGTTGQPKCARYLWSKLFAQVKRTGAHGDERWLLAYRLNHFAGIQMIAHVLCNRSTLVMSDSTQVADMIQAMQDFKVTHVSSTPTFWRFAMAMLNDRQGQIDLRHITLGSEAVSGDLLGQLHKLFPDARIVHIYASTEAGSCVSVSDMKPGLPVSVLNRPETADTQLRIVDGELQIRSVNGMSGYLDDGALRDSDGGPAEWRATGDLVRIEDDRIIFMGRKNETVNVGGVKVHPLDVENRISPLEGVKLVRAYGLKNPVVGQIVAVDVVCNEGYDPTLVEDQIHEACKVLVPAARPRSINFVDAILTKNMKLSRQ